MSLLIVTILRIGKGVLMHLNFIAATYNAYPVLLRYLEDFAVIGDVTTAMRDPAFYKWHGYLDDIFERHKEKLPSYTAPRVRTFEIPFIF